MSMSTVVPFLYRKYATVLCWCGVLVWYIAHLLMTAMMAVALLMHTGIFIRCFTTMNDMFTDLRVGFVSGINGMLSTHPIAY